MSGKPLSRQLLENTLFDLTIEINRDVDDQWHYILDLNRRPKAVAKKLAQLAKDLPDEEDPIMISARDSLIHLADCLSEQEAGYLISLVRSLPDIIKEMERIIISLDRLDQQTSVFICRGIISYLEPCSKILMREP